MPNRNPLYTDYTLIAPGQAEKKDLHGFFIKKSAKLRQIRVIRVLVLAFCA